MRSSIQPHLSGLERRDHPKEHRVPLFVVGEVSNLRAAREALPWRRHEIRLFPAWKSERHRDRPLVLLRPGNKGEKEGRTVRYEWQESWLGEEDLIPAASRLALFYFL